MNANKRRKRALEYATYKDVQHSSGGFLLPPDTTDDQAAARDSGKAPLLESGPEIGLDGTPLYRYAKGASLTLSLLKMYRVPVR